MGKGQSERYLAFYWTRPIKGVFETLPDNVEKAAKVSHTIDYQRYFTLSWLEEQKIKGRIAGYELIAEIVFLDSKFNGGARSEALAAKLDEVGRHARALNATLLYFKFEGTWRRVEEPVHRLRAMGVRVEAVPDIAGDEIIEHFRKREQEDAARRKMWRMSADEALRLAVEQIPPGWGRAKRIALYLNKKGERTRTGSEWTDMLVYKHLKSLVHPDGEKADI